MSQYRTGLSDLRRITAPAFTRQNASPSTTRAANSFERNLLRWLLRAVGNPPVRFVLWNGEEIGISREPIVAHVHIRDPGALRRLALHPELYFGEDYTAGRIEVEGYFVEFLETIYRGIARAPKAGLLRRALHTWLNRPCRNSLDDSRENIHHHYDLGNDFYSLWLDKEMVYTCAYFSAPTQSLEDEAKNQPTTSPKTKAIMAMIAGSTAFALLERSANLSKLQATGKPGRN